MKLIHLRELGGGRSSGILPAAGGEGLPVWTVQGAADGPTLVLTAGVHGCEYVGILALRRLFARLTATRLRGRVVMLPLVNGEGFFAGSKQVVPADGKNINRVFPPPEGGTRAEAIAWSIVEEIYPQADFLLDLHGGDVNEAMTPLVFYPAAARPDTARQAREGARHLEAAYRIPSSARNGLYSCAAQRGIPALLLEVGGMGQWTDGQVEMELRSIDSLMGFLGMGPQPRPNEGQQEAREMCYEEAPVQGLWFPAVCPGQEIRAGQTLGVLEDLEGQNLLTLKARWDGRVFYHTVSLGVAAGDALVAYGRCGG